MHALLQGLATAMQYPEYSAITASGYSNPEMAVLAAEEEASMEEARQDLAILFKNTARLIPTASASAVSGILQGLRQRQEV